MKMKKEKNWIWQSSFGAAEIRKCSKEMSKVCQFSLNFDCVSFMKTVHYT